MPLFVASIPASDIARQIPHISRTDALAKAHIYAKTRNAGDVTIRLPPSFTGLIRLTTSTSNATTSRHDRCQFDRRFEDEVISIPSRTQDASVREFFVGDVAKSGYLKGMSDEDWAGNLINVEVVRGRVRFAVGQEEVDRDARWETKTGDDPLRAMAARVWGLWVFVRSVL